MLHLHHLRCLIVRCSLLVAPACRLRVTTALRCFRIMCGPVCSDCVKLGPSIVLSSLSVAVLSVANNAAPQQATLPLGSQPVTGHQRPIGCFISVLSPRLTRRSIPVCAVFVRSDPVFSPSAALPNPHRPDEAEARGSLPSALGGFCVVPSRDAARARLPGGVDGVGCGVVG